MSTSPSPDSHAAIINAVKYWIEHSIIGLNFCPFAKKEFDRNSIHYEVIHSDKPEVQLTALVDELQRLDHNTGIATTVLILPSGVEDFFGYLDLLEMANQLLIDEGFEGIYQIASFHPDYYFDGCEADDPANYTNRSPYPIFHLLREASLEKVLAKYPNPEKIPERNIAKATELGVEVFKDLLGQAKQN